jgi:hypothetical protein
MTAFRVEFDWDQVGAITIDHEGKVAFPSLPTEPGVYRFRLTEAGPTTVYIGESVELRRRMAHYRNPGPTQPTNQRMNTRLREHLAANGRAELAIARRVVIGVGD